ncbi:MAG: hypothetical protein RL385_2988 [Pseudomonadota bacterium]|jgi:hypothetical protein
MLRRHAAFALMLGFAGCRGQEPIPTCGPAGTSTPLCGFQNPEDLALLPSGKHVLVSEYGESGWRPGRIAVLDLATHARTPLFEGGDPAAEGTAGRR